jgi:hypothetical protein
MSYISSVDRGRTERELDQTRATQPDAGAITLTSDAEGRDPDSIPAGLRNGNYVFGEMIGSGGGGTVYAATSATTGKRVAIKVLRAEMATSPQALLRFQREARVVNLIRHPAILEIYDFGQLPDGRPYFAMELLEGTDLTEHMREHGRFSAEAMLEVVTEVCAALTAAHAAGIVHRDLKASNLHIAYDGDGRCRVKLLDFGIAKLLLPDPELGGLTAPGVLLGTASAMAPEQIRGDPVDARTDVYSLGVLIYHMLTGHYPFRAETRHEIERMNLEAAPPRPSQSVMVPPAVDAVVLRCMDKRADRRFASVAEVATALREALAGGTAADRAARKQAVAIRVDVAMARDAEEADDQSLSDAADALDQAEQGLLRLGFVVTLHTATSLLTARPLPDGNEEARAERQRALDEAVALAAALAAGPGPSAGAFRVNVSVHVDAAVLRGSPPALEIVGPIVDVSTWPPSKPWKGVGATAGALAGLE